MCAAVYPSIATATSYSELDLDLNEAEKAKVECGIDSR